MFYCCGISDVGCARSHNEDAFLINNIVLTKAQLESNLKVPFIIGVADGVAGEKTGEIASRLALELLSNIKFSSKTNLKRKILDIHENVRSYGLIHDESLNMQSTLCALAIDENGIPYSINIGDSRMYLIRDNTLTQLTKDQSLAQLLVDAGKLENKNRNNYEKKNVIFPVIGNVTSPPCPDINKIEKFRHNDTLIICSDGLSDFVTENELLEKVTDKNHKFTERLKKLIDLAITNGSKDNITILALKFKEDVNETQT